MTIWFWVVLASYWLILYAFIYRNRRFRLSDIQGYKILEGSITPFDLSILSYLPILILWCFAIYPNAAEQYGLGYLAIAFIPALACMLFFNKRLWLLSARYGPIDKLFIMYFQSHQVGRLFGLITLTFSIIFMIAQARAAGIFLHIFSDGNFPVWLGITLALILPSMYLGWGGLKGLLIAYKLQLLVIVLSILALFVIILIHFSGWDTKDIYSTLTTKLGTNTHVPPGTIIHLSPISWNSLNFISFSLLFLAIPCLSTLMNIASSVKTTPTIKSFIVTWFGIGLIVVVALPVIFIATKSFNLDGLIDNSSSSSVAGGLSIFHPSFSNPSKLLPALLLMITEYKWASLLIGVGVFSSLQLLGAAYLCHTTKMITNSIVKPSDVSAKKSLVITLIAITIMVWLLSFIIDIPLLNLYVLAFALACQTLPAIIGLTYWSFLTRSGINLGMFGGCLTVILTDPLLVSQFIPDLLNPFQMQSVLCGLIINFIIAIGLSFATTDTDAIRNKQEFHNFLRGYAGLPRDKRYLKRPVGVAIILWILLAFSSVVLMSDYDFGVPVTEFTPPLIWAWQILCWLVAILLLWFLGKYMELAHCPYKSEAVKLNNHPHQKVT